MEKTFEIILNRFDGGMSNDLRVKIPNKYALTSHFDTSLPYKLVPQFKTEGLETKSYLISKFIYAPRSATTFRLWGFGETAVGKTDIYTHDIDGADTDWKQPSNATSTLSKNDSNSSGYCFFYYKGYIYFFGGTTKLCRIDYDSVDVIDDNYQSITHVTIAQAIHHSADDCAYFFADNIVYRLNNVTWGGAVLTLPDNLKIVAAYEMGTYLAIACTTKGISDIQSVVYLWDRDSSLITITQKINFGTGEIKHLAVLDNKLIAVMFRYGTNSLARTKVLIKQANGDTAFILNTIIGDTVESAQTYSNVIKDNKLYWPMQLTLNGDARLGIWATDGNGNVALEVIEEEATSIKGIFLTGNIWWLAHSSDGSVNRTDDGAAYSTILASVYESLINFGDPRVTSNRTWHIKRVGVMTEAMPSAGQIVLEYRTDANLDSTWNTIFTETTNDLIYRECKSSEFNIPNFRECQLRVESTGGAVFTGLKIEIELIDKVKL